ncbi:DegT/DnrJ/EryC1/StrS family aminotransferase [Xanthovirga aplysinae]|uniref:DegT/DnrJ/EryC1/StrS family aminotransferase n=1 Tax=Xanthovirga aplysinae TaxID=2529853 RepID=UPI0012BD0841|nr:DegT/DnrJ/EryC1/StrS family aminotransferase [Xanthovirga aplysinae]MTI29503.1 aminotransferase class I/II-fold pyridoxal phosphate-dependent enzyme [Xanthovirga aplysinae]
MEGLKEENLKETRPKAKINEDRIWLSPPHMGGEEKALITEAIDSNWVAPGGPFLRKFEKVLSNFVQCQSSLALSSGTAALHLALRLLGIRQGDEVICSSFTFTASANPILYQGATPVFIDSELETWNMCPNALEQAVQSRIVNGKKPKAIILVHLYGMPAKLGEIIDISKKYKIPLIEDAAEALGSNYKGKALGTFGQMGIYSFNGNKIITTSGGGALVSENPDLIKKALFFATQAKDGAPHYEHSQLGYNYRMSNVCAAIGVAQMKVLSERIRRRREIYAYYEKHLSVIKGIEFLPEPKGFYSNRWLSCILIHPEYIKGVNREQLRLRLLRHNIESRLLWKPLHLQPLYRNFPYFGNKFSERLFERGLCLPSGSALTKDQLDFIIGIIKESF